MDATDPRSEGDREDETVTLLQRASAGLMEHFDSVQIFVTRDNGPEQVTMASNWGGGNWYARYGSVREWLVQQEARAAENIRRQDADEEDE